MRPAEAQGRPPRAAAFLRARVRDLCRRWVWIYVGAITLYLGGALAAPLLSRAGYETLASGLYAVYRLSCHQLPHHSWFLGGPSSAYSWTAVQPFGPWGPEDEALAFHHPLRIPALGYQLAICQRDVAIWSALLVGSVVLVSASTRLGRGKPQPIRLRHYGLAALPMAIDAGTQLLGWRESTPLLRSLTGGLFGLATAALVVPLLAEGFADLQADLER